MNRYQEHTLAIEAVVGADEVICSRNTRYQDIGTSHELCCCIHNFSDETGDFLHLLDEAFCLVLITQQTKAGRAIVAIGHDALYGGTSRVSKSHQRIRVCTIALEEACGIELVVIERPREKRGVSFDEAKALLEERYGI